jgi:Cation transport protein.
MNVRLIARNLGYVLIIEAACMLPPLFVSLIYEQDDFYAFFITIMLMVVIGMVLLRIKVIHDNLYVRDGFAIVGLGWLLTSIFGALPFYFSGTADFIDSIFESISGFTTTGSTILQDIEGIPRGMLFWRSFTNWLGGMGILVMSLAVIPSVKPSSLYIMKAESPGPSPGKLVPRLRQTARILYAIYIVLTLVLIVLLVIAGMPVYDAFIHAFSTAGTGGFSSRNLSIGSYNNVAVEIIITIFMLLFGVNFSLYYQAIKGNLKAFLHDEEFRFYMGTVAAAVVLIAFNIYGTVYDNVWDCLRYSSFQVSSIITTTGYSTTDFNLWPVFSKTILVILMLVGASAGSTCGAIKCSRIVLLLKAARREIVRIIHPRSVYTVKINGKTVDEGTLSGVLSFFFLYMATLITSVLIVTLDGKDMVTSATAVITCIGNVGPGLGMVGPMGNFSGLSDLSKIILSADMIIGRLEILPVFMMFSPSFWRRREI